MATENGKDGKILIGATPVTDITKWSFTKKANIDKYASSSTAGFKAGTVGPKDGNGTIEFKQDGATVSPLLEGTAVTLLLYKNGTEYYTVPALISEFSLSVDIDTGTTTGATANFETNGAWTEPTLS